MSKQKVDYYQRVGMFIDVQNMFYSAKYLYHSRLNFSKLMDILVNGRRLVRAIAYIVETPDIDQTNFIQALKDIGYEIKSKTLKKRPDGSAKGDWDMGIALDTISMARKLDTIILVSGDGDFTELLYLLKSQGVRVEVSSFPNNTAEELIKAANLYIPLDNEYVIYNKRKKYRKTNTKKSTKTKKEK